MTRQHSGARAVAPVAAGPSLPDEPASFACAYAIDVKPGSGRPSEAWARDLWEGAPGVMRWFMTFGWRRVLGLRLGPRRSPQHILGWPIVESAADKTVCHLRSPFLTAYNTFELSDGMLVWSTFVYYERAIARLLWLPASLLHRPIVRLSLRRVQSQLGARSGK